MNRCTVSLRRAKHAAYYKPPQYIHPAKESRIPIALHPKFGNWENRDSMEHLEYMKQKVFILSKIFITRKLFFFNVRPKVKLSYISCIFL